MRCPICGSMPSGVLRTTRPLDEGLEYGEVKARLRKCRNCDKNFSTYEIQESLFKTLSIQENRLQRQPLQVEEESQESKKRRLGPKK